MAHPRIGNNMKNEVEIKYTVITTVQCPQCEQPHVVKATEKDHSPRLTCFNCDYTGYTHFQITRPVFSGAFVDEIPI